METGIISMPINEIELKDMPLSTRLSVIDDGIRKNILHVFQKCKLHR